MLEYTKIGEDGREDLWRLQVFNRHLQDHVAV